MDQWHQFPGRLAHRLGFDRGRTRAGLALAAVALFWTVGLLGGLRMLDGATSPLLTLVLLYLMLLAVVLSFVVAGAALIGLGRQARRRQ